MHLLSMLLFPLKEQSLGDGSSSTTAYDLAESLQNSQILTLQGKGIFGATVINTMHGKGIFGDKVITSMQGNVFVF